MARLYSNENFPQPAVEELQRLGHDVLTSLDAGKANQSLSDEELIRYATGEGRAVLTSNHRHFHTRIGSLLRTPELSRARSILTTWRLPRGSMPAFCASPDLKGKLIKVTKASA